MVPMRKDLVCSECGRELRECAPPKKKSMTKYIILAVAALIVLGGVGYAIFGGNGTTGTESALDTNTVSDIAKDTLAVTEPVTTVKSDTVVVHDTVVSNNTITTSEKISTKTVVNTTVPASKTPSAPAATSGNRTLRLSYGTYTGEVRGGYPHGQGRLTYSEARQICRFDAKARTANAGDYVIGEFYNGFVVYGKHYDSDGNLLESLNIGQGPEDVYESR